ncbi:hypothetical protein [Enterobacter sp.]|uniref:hypothetical protein n=1 Tax=Enterobacter sp. TaxID=42895 RepID=UPI00296E3D71|nr:hypothetical protein [Enterobacter sp.]
MKQNFFMTYTAGTQGLRGVFRSRSLSLRHRDYCRFAYFLCVAHFRKVSNIVKVGSGRNGRPVIAGHGYMAAYYQGSDFYVAR